jgi:hypothetical protein
MKTLDTGTYRLLLEATPGITRGTLIHVDTQRIVAVGVAAAPESVVESAATYLRVEGLAVEAAQLERHFRAVEALS